MTSNKNQYTLNPTYLSRQGWVRPFAVPLGTLKDSVQNGQQYRIFATQGWTSVRPELQQDWGTLSFRHSKEKDESQLLIKQRFVSEYQVNFVTQVSAKIENDSLSTPRSWESVTRFEGGAEERAGQSWSRREGVEVKNNVLIRSIGKSRYQTPFNTPFSTDWNLFDAVQRMPFEKGFSLSFSLLEGFRVLHPNHRILYKGVQKHLWNDEQVPFHCFHHFGSGMLPTEYFLTNEHQLVLVTRSYMAFIREHPHPKNTLSKAPSFEAWEVNS